VRAGSGGGVQPEELYWVRTCSACTLAQAAVPTVRAQSVTVAGVELQVGSLFLPCVQAVSWRGQCQGGQDAACGDRGADPESGGGEDALGGDAVRAGVAGQDLGEKRAEPRLPPMVRTMALTLVAMPVCDAGTDSMMVSVMAA
jgi:hypothetical protein